MSEIREKINYRQFALKALGLLCLFLFLAAIGVIELRVSSFSFLTFSAMFILLFYIIGPMVEFHLRPKTVELLDEGVVLKLRYGRMQKFRWDEIQEVDYIPADHPAVKKHRDGHLIMKPIYAGKPASFIISPETAVAVREKYKAAMGEYPRNIVTDG